jgi:hypothetical protein
MEHKSKCAGRVIASMFCLLFLVSGVAFGQDSEPLVIPSSTGEADFEFLSSEIRLLKRELDQSDLNRITLEQMGNLNQAFINQTSQYDPNLAHVYQDGTQNIFQLNQTGNNNAMDIIQQGNENMFLGTHHGDHILNKVIQQGNGNYIEQSLDADMLNFQINQFGNGHELIQTETRDGIGYKVTQEGPTGMKITIQQGNIYK